MPASAAEPVLAMTNKPFSPFSFFFCCGVNAFNVKPILLAVLLAGDFLFFVACTPSKSISPTLIRSCLLRPLRITSTPTCLSGSVAPTIRGRSLEITTFFPSNLVMTSPASKLPFSAGLSFTTLTINAPVASFIPNDSANSFVTS